MARRRFFVPEVRRGRAELSGSDAEHLVRVLRVEAGQLFEVSDNHCVYLAEVVTARKALVEFQIGELLTEPDPGPEINVIPALIKFDSFEWMIEKATELGVTAIRPFEATRSERGLRQASAKRLARWQRIGLEASQQSRRAHLPEIAAVGTFASAIRSPGTVRLLLDEIPGVPPLLEAVQGSSPWTGSVSLLVGPEGGWTETERSEAIEAGWLQCSLGATVLRAETAALAALAVVQAALFAARAAVTRVSE